MCRHKRCFFYFLFLIIFDDHKDELSARTERMLLMKHGSMARITEASERKTSATGTTRQIGSANPTRCMRTEKCCKNLIIVVFLLCFTNFAREFRAVIANNNGNNLQQRDPNRVVRRRELIELHIIVENLEKHS